MLDKEELLWKKRTELLLKSLKKVNFRLGKIKKLLGIKRKNDKDILEKILLDLEISERILEINGQYCLFPTKYKVKTLTSIGKGINQKIGFKKDDKIIFLNEQNLNGALPGDTVVLNTSSEKVVKILKRYQDIISCEVVVVNGIKLLKPLFVLGKDYLQLRIGHQDMKKLVEGELIQVKLDKLKSDDYYEAYFLNKIGHKNDPDIKLKMIAAAHGFFLDFSKEAIAEAEKLPSTISENDIIGRVDLRNEEIFTIDGKDTKDIDDAISLKILDNGNYQLGVHIADVSYYVKPGMKLFEEASKRCFSSYLIDSVIPMLPHKLSNGICSLNENEDRLTKSCFIEISPSGKILNYSIFSSVIRSRKKMNYDDVNSILIENKVPEGYEKFQKTLLLMNKLCQQLLNVSNSIDIESNEIKFIFENNEIKDIIKYESLNAQKIIEMFMIVANRCVAEYCNYLNILIPYRNHEEPSEEKIDYLIKILRELGYLKDVNFSNNIEVKLKQLINDVKDNREYPFLSTLILRNLKRANYQTINEGHFALQIPYYTHFTSPIRRLPDLLVHYQLALALDGIYPKRSIQEIELEELCYRASFMELQADLAEEDANIMKMLEFVSNHIGKNFYCYVTGFGKDGIIVKTINNIPGIITYESLFGNQEFKIKNSILIQNGEELFKIGNVILTEAANVSYVDSLVIFNFIRNESLKQSVSSSSILIRKKFVG